VVTPEFNRIEKIEDRRSPARPVMPMANPGIIRLVSSRRKNTFSESSGLR
jgi:hypothetical protein